MAGKQRLLMFSLAGVGIHFGFYISVILWHKIFNIIINFIPRVEKYMSPRLILSRVVLGKENVFSFNYEKST